MKSINKFALLFAAAGTLVSCSNDDALVKVSENSGKTVHMVVKALRDGEQDMESRTALNENQGNLAFTWTANDKILVTDGNGIKKGFLELKSGAGTNSGTFEGNLIGLDNGSITLNYYYLGLKNSSEGYKDVQGEQPYTADYSKQLGTLESLSDYDMLSTSNQTVISGDYSYSEYINLKRRVSFARFLMNLPDAAEAPYRVTLSGAEIGNKATIQLTNADATLDKMKYDKGDVVLENLTSKDFYITYLPTQKYPYDIIFKVEDANGKSYTGKFEITQAVGQSKYLRRSNVVAGVTTYQGLPVDFTADVPDYDIIFKADPEGKTDYDFEEDLTDPANVELPGDPKPDTHKEFLGWKEEGKDGEPTKGPWDLTQNGPVVTLVPVYGDYIWNIEWRSGYGDNALVEHQGQTVYKNAETGKQAQIYTPYGLNGKNVAYNPTREGFTFVKWVNGDKEAVANAEKTQYIRFYKDEWTHVWTAVWNRVYEIVYHFDSADPNHSPSGDANFNAMITDRPVKAEDGFDYSVIFDTATFKDQGGVAQTDANGGKFLGWRKSTKYSDDYTETDAERVITSEDNIWTFSGGKWRLHLEPVYSEPESQTTITTPGYGHGEFN